MYKITANHAVRDSDEVDEQGADNSENPENTGGNQSDANHREHQNQSPSYNRALKPNIVRLPKDRGITGLAISTKAVQLVPNGEYHV